MLIMAWIAAFMANIHFNQDKPLAFFLCLVVLILAAFPVLGLL